MDFCIIKYSADLISIWNYSGTSFERPPWQLINPTGKATWLCKSKHKCIDIYPWREATHIERHKFGENGLTRGFYWINLVISWSCDLPCGAAEDTVTFGSVGLVIAMAATITATMAMSPTAATTKVSNRLLSDARETKEQNIQCEYYFFYLNIVLFKKGTGQQDWSLLITFDNYQERRCLISPWFSFCSHQVIVSLTFISTCL